VAVAGGERVVDGMGKLPLGAGNDGAGTVARVADGEHVARIVGRRSGVFAAADRGSHQVTERNLRRRFGEHQVATQQPGDGLAIFFRDGRIEPQGARPVGVPLPAEAHNGESVAQQPRVSGVVCEDGVASVDEGKDTAVATVGSLEEERAVAFVRVFRADGNKVGGELDLTVFQVDRVAEVDDGQVMRVGYRE